MIGQLGDLTLSRREELDARVRAIELLSTHPSERGRDVLLELLREEDLRLRRAAALGLLSMSQVIPSIVPKTNLLIEYAGKELRRPSLTVEPKTAFERSSPFFRDARGRQLASSVEYVFLLLAISTRNAERLQLALAGITSEDEHQRGTALEYLDNLLPSALRDRLLALARHPERTAAQPVFDAGVVKELASKLREETIDIKTLRKQYRQAQRARYHQS